MTPEIKENLSVQLSELETLQSVYPKEVHICDQGNLADINEIVSGTSDEIPQNLEYIINLSVLEEIIEIIVNLPLKYPEVGPNIYCRCSVFDRSEQLRFNQSLKSYIETLDKGEPLIYSLICWVQDNADVYLTNSRANKNNEIKLSDKETSTCEFVRYWIKSHHIYSKFKRKEIIDLAKSNSLTGFCLAGKPGVICMEGSVKDCDYVWQQIRAMQWQKIVLKFMEKDFSETDNVNNYRKFTDFQEVTFPSTERHNDMTQVVKFLKKLELEYAFKEIFGLDAKVSQTDL